MIKKKRKILIVIQHVKREYDFARELCDHLKSQGHEVRLSMTGSYLEYNLVIFAPDIVFMPWVTNRFMNMLKEYSCNPVIINSFQEQNLLVDRAQNTHVNQLKLTDVFFAWGEIYKERALMINSKLKVHVTGNPRSFILDKISKRNVNSHKNRILKNFGIKANKRIVLFALDYAILFKEDRQEFALKNGLLTEDYLETTRKSYLALPELVAKISSRLPKDHHLIIRPHPGSNRDQIYNDLGIAQHANISIIDDLNIIEWISICEKYITRLSSSIVEAWYLNKPTCLIHREFSIDEIDEMIHISGNKNSSAFNDDEVIEFIVSQEVKYRDQTDFLTNYLPRNSRNVLQSTADQIMTIDCTEYKPKFRLRLLLVVCKNLSKHIILILHRWLGYPTRIRFEHY